MSPYYYQARKKKGGLKKGVSGLFLFLVSVLLLVCGFAPAFTGRFGQAIHDAFLRFAGWASYLIPIYIGWMGVQQFLGEKSSKLRDTLLSFLFLISLACLAALIPGGATGFGGLGGWLGDRVSLFLVQQFGALLVALFSVSLLFVSGALLARFSPILLIHDLREKIIQDIQEWKEQRKKMRDQNALKNKLEQLGFPESERKDGRMARESGVPLIHPDLSKPPAVPVAASPSPLDSILDSRLKNLFQKQDARPVKKGPAPAPVKEPAAPANGNGGQAAAVPPALMYEKYVLPDPDLLSIPEQSIPALRQRDPP